LSQVIISLERVDPVEFLGVHNAKIDILKKTYPKLKIVSRGNNIKITGSDKEVTQLNEKIELMMQYIEKYGFLSNNIILGLLTDPEGTKELINSYKDDVILIGQRGQPIKAKTPNQQKIVDLSKSNDILFYYWPCRYRENIYCCGISCQSVKAEAG